MPGVIKKQQSLCWFSFVLSLSKDERRAYAAGKACFYGLAIQRRLRPKTPFDGLRANGIYLPDAAAVTKKQQILCWFSFVLSLSKDERRAYAAGKACFYGLAI